ncbi:MAG: protein-S-isoprenylcysteine O-methyltransferase Ste14 [Marinoscillum sp.]|jgi:protein-S-isoprenylcysteine O-methyltransferase Ste14
MWINYVVIFIYLSFAIDLLIWPIPSEASTSSLISKERDLATFKSIKGMLLLLFSLIFYLFPLYLSMNQFIIAEALLSPTSVVLLGLSLAVLGRFVSLKASQVLRNNHEVSMVSSSVFKWSRNPITLGMHITIFGLIICYNSFILYFGFILYAVNLHGKIKIEENYLADKFGKKYLRYMKKTPRYLCI